MSPENGHEASLEWLSKIPDDRLRAIVSAVPGNLELRRLVMIELQHRAGVKPGPLPGNDQRPSELSGLGVDTEDELTKERLRLSGALEELLPDNQREEGSDEPHQ